MNIAKAIINYNILAGDLKLLSHNLHRSVLAGMYINNNVSVLGVATLFKDIHHCTLVVRCAFSEPSEKAD